MHRYERFQTQACAHGSSGNSRVVDCDGCDAGVLVEILVGRKTG